MIIKQVHNKIKYILGNFRKVPERGSIRSRTHPRSREVRETTQLMRIACDERTKRLRAHGIHVLNAQLRQLRHLRETRRVYAVPRGNLQ